MNTGKHFTRIFLLILLSGILSIGCSSSKNCCENSSKNTDEEIYCNSHRDVIIKYVKATTDLAERKSRLVKIKKLYDTIKLCNTLPCLESWIFGETELPGFKERYILEHASAEQRTRFQQNKLKKSLILCGFRDGMKAMEISFLGDVVK